MRLIKIKKIVSYIISKPAYYYTLATLVTTGGNFFVTIFLWNIFGAKEYAKIAIVEFVPIFITGLMTFSLDQYLMRHYYEWSNDVRVANIRFLWLSAIINSTVVLLLGGIFIYIITVYTQNYSELWVLISLSLLNVYVSCLYNVPFSVLRITKSAKSFFVVKVTSFFCYALCVYISTVLFAVGVEGYYYSLIFSNVIHLILVIILRPDLTIRSPNVLHDIKFTDVIGYSKHLVITGVISALYGVIERALLVRFASFEQIGYYSIAGRFSEIINSVHGIIKLSYGPDLFKAISSGEQRSIDEFSKRVKHYIAPIAALFIVMLTFNEQILFAINLNDSQNVSVILNYTLVFTVINALQIYVAPGPIITKSTKLKMILDSILVFFLSIGTYFSLHGFDVINMVLIKSVLISLYVVACYFLTQKLINWKIDIYFIFINIISVASIVLLDLFDLNIIAFIVAFVALFFNFKSIKF
jgi:O-antigen/teichoic acid export membrane protein